MIKNMKSFIVMVLLAALILNAATRSELLAETVTSKVRLSEVANYRGYIGWNQADMDTKIAIVTICFDEVWWRYFEFQVSNEPNPYSIDSMKRYLPKYQKFRESLYIDDIISYIDNKYSKLSNMHRRVEDLIYSFLVETIKSMDKLNKNRAIDAAVSELNGRECLIWADVKISVNGYTNDTVVVDRMDKDLGDYYIWLEGPNKWGGKLKFIDTSVTLQRIPSKMECPGVWLIR